MGTKLYVGNLPFNVDEEQLRVLFAGEGREVREVHIVTDRDTGRPRGFAFVEMGTEEDAKAAATSLNGSEIGGRTLTVQEARERNRGAGREDRGRGGRRGGGDFRRRF